MRVNTEQASKMNGADVDLAFDEGRQHGRNEERMQRPSDLPGYW